MLTTYFASGGSDRLAALLKAQSPDAYDDANVSEAAHCDHATSEDADARRKEGNA